MQVTVPKPDVKGRTEILNWYLKKVKVDPGKLGRGGWFGGGDPLKLLDVIFIHKVLFCVWYEINLFDV